MRKMFQEHFLENVPEKCSGPVLLMFRGGVFFGRERAAPGRGGTLVSEKGTSPRRVLADAAPRSANPQTVLKTFFGT